MKLTIIGILAFAVVTGSCKPKSEEIELSLAEVGDKTDLYTVVAANRLELAPGVTMQPTDGPCGSGSGMLLMRQGEIGGYVTCGCVGATTSTCKTSNDNPQHVRPRGQDPRRPAYQLAGSQADELLNYAAMVERICSQYRSKFQGL